MATSGSTPAARRAGIQVASDATVMTAAATTAAPPTIHVVFEYRPAKVDTRRCSAAALSGSPSTMPSASAERDTDADLAMSLPNAERDDAVQADGGEQEGEHAAASGAPGDYHHIVAILTPNLFERPEVVDLNVGYRCADEL